MQVQTDDDTTQIERVSNDLSHISIRAESILVPREQINHREGDNKRDNDDSDDFENRLYGRMAGWPTFFPADVSCSLLNKGPDSGESGLFLLGPVS